VAGQLATMFQWIKMSIVSVYAHNLEQSFGTGDLKTGCGSPEIIVIFSQYQSGPNVHDNAKNGMVSLLSIVLSGPQYLELGLKQFGFRVVRL
jgi:hypothetical protein